MLAGRVGAVVAAEVWQSSQLLPLVTWVACLPVAMTPLWQELQMPTTCVWSTASAGDHWTLLWQSSHTLVVLMWVGVLPVASMPLWQLTQFPVMVE